MDKNRRFEMTLREKMLRSEFLKDNLIFVQGLKTKNRADFYFAEDVKEFIVKIKATMLLTPSPTERGKFIQWLAREIDKLAGEELVK